MGEETVNSGIENDMTESGKTTFIMWLLSGIFICGFILVMRGCESYKERQSAEDNAQENAMLAEIESAKAEVANQLGANEKAAMLMFQEGQWINVQLNWDEETGVFDCNSVDGISPNDYGIGYSTSDKEVSEKEYDISVLNERLELIELIGSGRFAEAFDINESDSSSIYWKLRILQQPECKRHREVIQAVLDSKPSGTFVDSDKINKVLDQMNDRELEIRDKYKNK